MKRFVLLFLAISLALIPCLAQDETATNVDEFVEELNALCPISYDEDWGDECRDRRFFLHQRRYSDGPGRSKAQALSQIGDGILYGGPAGDPVV